MCCSKGKFSEEVKRENEIQWNMVTGTFKMAKKKGKSARIKGQNKVNKRARGEGRCKGKCKKKSMQDFSSVTLIIPSDLFILSKTAT